MTRNEGTIDRVARVALLVLAFRGLYTPWT